VSCPPESIALAYVDAELAREELRSFESHLLGCRDCRTLVVALRDESSLIADALLERQRAPSRAVRPELPERGVALGLPLAIGTVSVAFAVAGFLIESRIPGGLDLVHPLRLKGVIEMAFDFVFLLRDRIPGLVELALSLGIVASVSALLTFAVSALYRRVYGAAALGIAALLISAPGPASALVVSFDQETDVGAGQIIEESMLLSGDDVRIDGTVEGDVVAAAERIRIAGNVRGSLYVFARRLEITGTVSGAVHAVAEEVRIDGEVVGTVFVLGETFALGSGGRVARDLAVGAEHATLDGMVGRDVIFGGDRLEIAAVVGRHVDARWVESLRLRDGARVAGNVDAHLPEGDEVDRAPGATVSGEVRVLPRESRHERYFAHYAEPAFYLMHALAFVAAFVFGILLYALVPGLFEARVHTSREFFRALGLGFVALVVPPIAILAVALTVIGIPAAVLSLFVYVTALYTAEIVVGTWLGRTLLPPRDDSMYALGRSLLAGLAILVVLEHIPFLGPPISVIALLMGLGLLVERARQLPQLRGE
jgi:cytoskeletal protein CcmA (bactofilin family)